MQNRIALISDDSDFFEYILPKLDLRKSDELYKFKFDDVTEKLDFLLYSVLIINSEHAEEKTCELLSFVKGTPSFVFSYNFDEKLYLKCIKLGALACLNMLTSDDEFNARLANAFNLLAEIQKRKNYRDILVEKNILHQNNEVYMDYTNILDKELKKISMNAKSAILFAISPNEKTKFLLQPNQIETFILGNIRKTDILMNFAPNKYFLLMYDANEDEAKKIWEKIQKCIPEKIYAGLARTGKKTRGQLVNEALNKLHEAINRDYSIVPEEKTSGINSTGNFKIFRKEFNKKLEQIVTPVFYHIQQKYAGKLFGVNMCHQIEDGCAIIYMKSRYLEGYLKITAPGCTKINIDIEYSCIQENKNTDSNHNRITFEPSEFEEGLLQDILEQFITEYKKGVEDEYTL